VTAKVAQSESTTVLIEGESGTGKGLVARAIHSRAAGATPALAVNCSSFQERPENELFGHERGAFTDAREAKRGLVELADEARCSGRGRRPAGRDAGQFLRFIEDRTFKGAASDLSVDSRAPRTGIEQLVQAGSSARTSLSNEGRRSTCQPLRERGDDAPSGPALPLVLQRQKPKAFLLDHAGGRGDLPRLPVAGNVRGWKNLLERIVLLENDERPRRPPSRPR
jgi:transcriptional regulator with AAA-type ATPase domain